MASDKPAAGTVYELAVADGDGGRLDQYLAERLDLTRSRVAGLIAQGFVEVDGKPPRKSHPVIPGERIRVLVPPPEPLDVVPEPIPLDIVHEDAHLVVVDKPPGMVVHPGPGHATGTLVHALLHHIRDLSGIGGRLRPGIVHRLDRDTSGLLVVAKSDEAHVALAADLKDRAVTRRYTAAAWGRLPESPMTVNAPIGRHRSDRKRMAVNEKGRSAFTEFEVLETWPAAQLLDVSLGTGRTHQIRVHLLHIGHPVVGDETYGSGWERGMSGAAARWAASLAKRASRQFLHAREFSFRHPGSGREMRFVSPLPPDLAAVARWARGEEV